MRSIRWPMADCPRLVRPAGQCDADPVSGRPHSAGMRSGSALQRSNAIKSDTVTRDCPSSTILRLRRSCQYQTAVRPGFRADRGRRGPAAFLRERSGSRSIGRAVLPTTRRSAPDPIAAAPGPGAEASSRNCRPTAAMPSQEADRNFFAPLVKWITYARAIPGHYPVTGWREPISISGAGKAVSVILRRRPCFLCAGHVCALTASAGVARPQAGRVALADIAG